MSTAVIPAPSGTTTTAAKETKSVPVVITRRRIDRVLIAFGALATLVFGVAGGLLTWGHNFADDYVRKELSSQHIAFPSAEALTSEGRADLAGFGGQAVVNGDQAEAYASYINGHLAKVADGATYADLGTPQRAAAKAVTDAKAAGEPQATIDDLQAKADALTAQRTTLFQGETLRGLLLSAYAWATVGSIAGYAAIAAFAAAAAMLVLVVLGFVHVRRAHATA
jgi:hypothetical protein